MNEGMHPDPEALEALASDELAAAERAVVESHVLRCATCHSSVEEWRSLFAMLASLPRYSPAPGFGERVMAGVRVPLPWRERVNRWAKQWAEAIDRITPKTTRGWAVACAILALPVIASGGVFYWLLASSYVTTHDLWLFATDRFGEAATGAGSWLIQRVLETDVAIWTMQSLGAVVEAQGVGGLGMIAALIGAGMLASGWILYTNLIRTPARDSNYVTYCI